VSDSEQPVLPEEAPPAPPRRRGLLWEQKLCIGATLALLLIGCIGLLSCCLSPEAPPGARTVPAAPPLASGPTVQVRLAVGEKALAVQAEAGGKWYASGGRWESQVTGGSCDIELKGDLISIAGLRDGLTSVVFAPQDGVFVLNGRARRGSLLVEVKGADGLSATELVDVEDYVRGVVPTEMPWYWPSEALKAQAVAARTFCLHRAFAIDARRHYLTLRDMAYGGVSQERAHSDLAVKETQGQVLTYAGKLFPSYFHTCCGGGTSDAKSVFEHHAVPPLHGVPCSWCKDSPHYKWEARIAADELASRLALPDIARIATIRPEGIDAVGRYHQVLINGKTKMSAGEFRMAVGSHKLRSTMFSVRARGAEFEFSGRGWGHGVGMCQWGARKLAKEAKSWREILTHYYPGALVTEFNPEDARP